MKVCRKENGKFPSYCCQKCGYVVGYVGRALGVIRIQRHDCQE